MSARPSIGSHPECRPAARAHLLAVVLVFATIGFPTSPVSALAQAAADEEEGDAVSTAAEASPRKWTRSNLRVEAELRLTHSDNLHHVKSSQQGDFATETDPYERFHGMDGPSDELARLSLALRWRWKHASKRAVALELGLDYTGHRRNRIADYGSVKLEGNFDLSKDDGLRIQLDHVPTRFKKNYADEAFPGIRVYSRADLRQTAWELRYTRRWARRWWTLAKLAHRERDYEAPFDNRDQGWTSLRVAGRWRPTKRLTLELGAGRHRARTPSRPEFGIPTDRSYDADEASVEIDIQLPHRWSVEASAELELRDYRTTVIDDTARFGRRDRRWSNGLSVEKRLKAGLYLRLEASWLDNAPGSDLIDLSGDEVGYREAVIAASLRFRT